MRVQVSREVSRDKHYLRVYLVRKKYIVSARMGRGVPRTLKKGEVL